LSLDAGTNVQEKTLGQGLTALFFVKQKSLSGIIIFLHDYYKMPRSHQITPTVSAYMNGTAKIVYKDFISNKVKGTMTIKTQPTGKVVQSFVPHDKNNSIYGWKAIKHASKSKTLPKVAGGKKSSKS
jgi:hypothetical protein